MARLGQFRGDTLENWKKENAIIPDREFILIASDASKPTTYDFWACGDGITHFEDLPMNGNGGGSGGAMTVLQGLGDNTESPMSQEAVTRYISEYIVSNYHTNPATGKNVFTALEAINLVPIYIRRLGLKCGFLTLVDPTQEITRLVMIQYIGKSLSESDWTNLNNWSSLDIQVESTLTVFIFKISPTEPATPVGGYWNTEANIVVYPEGWTGTDFSSEGDIVWMSVGIFGADGNLKGEWSKPIRVTGEDGTDGTDGSSIEFIYKLTKTDKVVPSTPDNKPNESQYVPEGWTNHPTGISLEMQVEWVCTRTKQENGVWNNWTTPVMWSKYGVNGKDGDGVEYIYKLNNTGVAPDRPTEVSQEPEFVPDGWTDNPSGISASNKYEWVCIRKFRDGLWGEFSNPALWAKYGDNGQTGNSARTMYCKTANASTVPEVNASNINPGSIWGVTIPSYSGTEVVWGIQAIVAYDNTLVQDWQGPYLITGINGKDGTPPNYKTYVFKLSDSKPSAPTSNDPTSPGGGWVDYPNQEGNWWQCVGSVNGVTGLVTEWGEVIPLNGRDGTAQDGKFTEFRFAKSSTSTPPTVSASARFPGGWTLLFPEISDSEILWMIKAVINPDDTLYSNWEGPIRISGERGPIGETGPAGKDGINGSQGVAGIPGVDIELRFSLGTDTTYDATWNNTVKTTRNPTSFGWSLQMPTPTDSKLYIWLIQARIAHQVNGDAGTLETGSWSEPIRLNGINGLPGPQGKKGQVVYPAGVYGNTVSYTTTETKAPYVYDPSDGNFYVLNAIMTWLGTEQNNRTPSQSYAESQGLYWLKFDAYEAIYAKIGIIANGLIGSAVFNGNYMFSQQGTDADGNPSSNYEEFTGGADSPFKPNLLINFNTGDLTYKGVSQILAYHMEENERLDINNEFPYNKIVAAEGCTIGFKNSNRYNPRRIEVEGVCTYNYALTGTYVNNVKLDTSLEYVKIMESITIEYPADGQIYAYNTPDLFTKTGRFGEFSIVANNMVGVTTANTIFGSQNVAQIMFSNNTAGIVVLKNDERRVLYPFDISTVLPVRLSRASLDYVKGKWWDVQAQLQIRRNTSNTANEVSFVVQYPSEVRNLEDDVISCSGQLLVVG
ncbi:hypothetical protein DAC20_166 [Bacteroides phage DAC20]|nr:hypothetical protein DAC19_167 [Bacteroides phage DAC19]QIG63916.1 hypothetical protein DAC20_166 [Bacteroides phage DAC20]